MIVRGHRVTLVTPSEARINAEARGRGIPVVNLPVGRKQPRGILALRAWLKSNPVDIINTHSSTDSWLAALAVIGLKDAPLIVRTRHISAPVPGNRATNWLYQRATKHIVTTGEKLRQTLVRENGFRAESITSIPTGIDTDHYSPGDRAAARQALNLPADAAMIGIVATLRSWKGHRYLLDAFQQLQRANTYLVIVGDGPQRGALREHIAALGIANQVVMPGNQQDVLPWLRAMDIFVLPSYANEGVPQAILQAMACGLPVISTPVGSITEAVDDLVTGLLVPPHDATALKQAIARLLDDAEERARFGHAGRAKAERQFGSDRMLDAMEAVFLQAAERHG